MNEGEAVWHRQCRPQSALISHFIHSFTQEICRMLTFLRVLVVKKWVRHHPCPPWAHIFLPLLELQTYFSTVDWKDLQNQWMLPTLHTLVRIPLSRSCWHADPESVGLGWTWASTAEIAAVGPRHTKICSSEAVSTSVSLRQSQHLLSSWLELESRCRKSLVV